MDYAKQQNELCRLVTSIEAARILRISPRKLWSITAPRGDLPVVRIDRSVRYSPDALRQWIARHEEMGGEK